MVKVFKLPANLEADPNQPRLELEDLDGCRIDAFGMGVLSDGTPFLTQRGLATICGVENAHIGTISTQWDDAIPKPRINKIRDLLKRNGHTLDQTHRVVTVNGRTIFAYGEEITLAVLEYYAFEAGQYCQAEARENFRILAGIGFRKAIYDSIDYNPVREVDDQWKPFHDRVSLVYHSAPAGYFSIFKETADLQVTLGQSGIHANDAVIPDISVGRAWGRHWSEKKLHKEFGERLTYKHFYPDYFPQSASNPQHPWCYPDAALPEFRRWLRDDYIRGGSLSAYIKGQVKSRGLSLMSADKVLEAYDLPTVQIGTKK